MEKSIEVCGKDIDEAKKNALQELNAQKDEEIIFEVINEPSKGILGIIGNKEARVKATVRQLTVLERAEKFVIEFFKLAGIEIDLSTKEIENGYYFSIKGDNMGIMIGKHGQTLDALQYLTNLAANRGLNENRRYIVLDIEDYRIHRQETLTRLANNLAQRVKSLKKPISLEPMSRHERKIIHTALQDQKEVTTYSNGEEPNRYIIIDLKINVD